MTKTNLGFPCACVWVWVSMMASSANLFGAGIKGSKHDLSSTSSGGSSQVCLFCHTPHRANNTLGPAFAPLWNRYVDTTVVFTVYSSATMISTPENPSQGPSAVCLGCHDGTLARATVYGITGDEKHSLINKPAGGASAKCQKCHPGHSAGNYYASGIMMGRDLRKMHPISMLYPTTMESEFLAPLDAKKGWSDVKLFNGRVECSSCHSVHDPAISPFLRKSNNGSALCLNCHIQ